MTQDMTTRTKQFRWLALFSNLALISLVVLWQWYLSPHPHINNLTLAIAWCVPLLLPLPGILAGKPYTHAWANFVLMLYFLHALVILTIGEGEILLASIELGLTTMAFTGNILYTRARGKELGTKLIRLSQVEKQEKARFNDS
ncbi:DUF2069 domain-containing protein [Vibrio lamellibrachiae]|uniref:DUF2069 domain-containing protein n=1 Tax=Vibrio lamellibrachiae TaxID=2910253 RepID=UPI003D0ECE67